MKKPPPLPRPFTLHFGKGLVIEEARIRTKWHEPAIQLLKFTSGPAKGTLAVRFCYFNGAGMFQKSPMMVDAENLRKLKGALRGCPRLRKLLAL